MYADFEAIEKELTEKVWSAENNFRIGTGELGDSLALEPVGGFSARLVCLFAEHGTGILELKTKTSDISSLLNLDHRGRTVLGWSVNSPFIISTEERDTASLPHRLEAARSALDAGYLVSFHLDPAIYYNEWDTGYTELFDMMGDIVGQDKGVVWFSIGGMRFMPALKKIIQENHPDSITAAGEFIEGLDSKKRYYRKIREEMFPNFYSKAQRLFPDAVVYFCMESERIWKYAAGYHPGSKGLKQRLDQTVRGTLAK
jgi:spore photoproduct lyase